jgi:hypothetical protein
MSTVELEVTSPEPIHTENPQLVGKVALILHYAPRHHGVLRRAVLAPFILKLNTA